MYRLLEVGEVIEKGDEFWEGDKNCWSNATHSVGQVLLITSPVRRKITEPAKPAASVPPVKPAAVVSVGDRVRVLSGPWAGCTGVVIEFQAEVSIAPGGMVAVKDSAPVVVLDNVFVGGSRLSVSLSASDVEPVPPTVIWRELEIGEVIREGDEVDPPNWRPSVRIGQTQERFHCTARRPARIQSPGWRYLDAGETVKGTDEVWSGLFNRYVPAYADRGSCQNEKLFRRKLPVNQGG